jgi:hypothetical protein
MSKQRPQTPSASARTSFRSQLLQSATWLGWEMPTSDTALPPRQTATPPAPQLDATPPLGLPAGSELA